MQPIDPILVEIIDAVSSGRSCQKAIETWSLRSEEYRQTIGRESDYSLSEAEMARLLELPQLHSELDRQVALVEAGNSDPDTLMGSGIAFFARLSELTNDRQATFFVEIPEFDKLLCAGKAILEGRAVEFAPQRLSAAKEERERIEALFSPHAESFPQDFQNGMKEGFVLMDEGLDELDRYTETRDPKAMSDALTKVNRGGQMIATFPIAVREMQMESRRHVPVIGSLLETLEVEPTDEYLALLRDEGLPELRTLWEEKDDGWLLPPTEAEPILAEVSAALDQFEQAVPSFRQAPEAFWQSVKRLEDAFRDVRSNSMPIQNILDSSLGPEASLVLALLEGKAPDYAAKTAIEAMRAGEVPEFITEFADGLEEYLESRDKLVLLELLELLLEQS